MLSTPPRLMPGDSSVWMKITGTLTCTLGHAQEIGWERTIGHGMKGDILGQGAHLLAADFDHDDRVEEVAGSQQVVEELFLDMHHLGAFIVPVTDGGERA